MVRVFVKGGAWTNAEDEALRALVQKVGLNRWASIATSIAHKSPEQCQQRWVDFLDPAINKGDWTAAEKRKLVQMYEIFPEQWQTIASQLPGRRHWQAKIMYAQLRDGGKLAEHGDGEEVVGSADGEIVGFGDYKLYHEMRAARADTIDGDEYSKQVTEFTRTRLANQKGKKQLRKEKDIMLAQTKMLAALERRREMEAAGIETHTQKKAFRRAVEEDAKSRLLAAGGALPEDEDGDDDDEDDTAREPKPVVADLADIISSNDAIRQAASRKKTMLMSKDLNASSKKKEAALVPDFDIVGSVGSQSKKPSGAAGSFTSPSSPIHVVGNRKQQQHLSASSSSSTAKSTLLAITSHSHALGQSDALSALMSHYLSSESSSVSRLDKVTLDAKSMTVGGGGGEGGEMSFVTKADLHVLGTINEGAAPKNTTEQLHQEEIGSGTTDLLNFDSLPQPSSASAAIHDDLGDLFGDLPAPSAANVHSNDAAGEDDALLNFEFLSDPTTDASDNVGGKRDAHLSLAGDEEAGKGGEEDEDVEEEEEEEEERVNYVYKASALLNRHSRILWDAKGEWDSARQQTDYIKQARELIDAELRFIHSPSLGLSSENDTCNGMALSPSLSATADEGDNALFGDANRKHSNTSEPPKLVHPRVARMMEFAAKIANNRIDLSAAERLKEEINSVAAAVEALGDSDEDAFAEAELFASEARRVKGFFFVSYPTLETRVLEEEVEAESVRANCADDLGLAHLVSSSRDHPFTIDDAAPIVSASEARGEAYASMREAQLGLDFYKEAFNTELLEAGRRRMVQIATPQGLLKPSTSADTKSSTTAVQQWQQVKRAHSSLARPLVHALSAEKRPRENSDTTHVGHRGDALDMLAAMYGTVA